jgi:hypothetical protein
MVTGSVTAGSAPRPVAFTTIVFTPVPGMAKFMMSAPGVALACWMAALKVHWSPPVNTSVSQVLEAGNASGASAVEFTVKVVAAWAGLAAIRPAAISAAISAPAASAFAFLPYNSFSLLDPTFIALLPFCSVSSFSFRALRPVLLVA